VTQSLAAGHSPSTARSTSPSAVPEGERSYLEIDLGRVEANLHTLGEHLRAERSADAANSVKDGPRRPENSGPPAVCAVVKKQAYGLGATAIASRLVKAGVEMLAVYDAAEAEQLVTAGITAPMLVLMPVRTLNRTNALYRHATRGRLHLAVHEPDQLAALNEVGHRFGLTLPVHLYLDTGMSRAGLSCEQLADAIAQAQGLRFVRVAGLYSHLATADGDGQFTETQRCRFQQALQEHEPLLDRNTTRHLANTCGILRDPSLHYDMVRPGLGLFGYGPEQMTDRTLHGAASPQAVLRWMSRLIHVQQYAAGSAVGYGATDVLDRDSTLGVVPVGYGDGYPLELSNQAVVRIEGPGGQWHEAPVRGRVSMDQLVVDLTEVPASADAPGALSDAPVEVYSSDAEAANALPRLAELAHTHCYELLCRLSSSLKRQYING